MLHGQKPNKDPLGLQELGSPMNRSFLNDRLERLGDELAEPKARGASHILDPQEDIALIGILEGVALRSSKHHVGLVSDIDPEVASLDSSDWAAIAQWSSRGFPGRSGRSRGRFDCVSQSRLEEL